MTRGALNLRERFLQAETSSYRGYVNEISRLKLIDTDDEHPGNDARNLYVSFNTEIRRDVSQPKAFFLYDKDYVLDIRLGILYRFDLC
jgi:hypothetical protein